MYDADDEMNRLHEFMREEAAVREEQKVKLNKKALLTGLLNDLLLIIESEDYSMLKEYKRDINTLLNEESE